jgi:heme oxygenase
MQLRQATAPFHHRVEDQLRLLDAKLSLERYSRVLEVFLGFYAPVEAGLLAIGPSLGLSLRDRSELLRCDLVALGLSRHDVANLPRCTELPRLSSLEDAAGCLYVIEGACLGGQVVARAVNRRLGIASATGGSFFVGDGKRTSLRWATVLAWLEGFGGARTEHVVLAACATFESLSRWITRSQS